MKTETKTKKDAVVYGVFVTIAVAILVCSSVIGIGSAHAQATNVSGATTSFPVMPTATTTAFPYSITPQTETTDAASSAPSTNNSNPTSASSTSTGTSYYSSNSSGNVTPTSTPMPQILSVDATGNVLLRGTVASVNSNVIVVNSWGGSWTIQTSNATQVVPAGSSSASDIAGIGVGDFVGVSGVIASGNPWAINATIVHDWTTSPGSVSGSANTSGTGVVPTMTTAGTSSPAAETPSGDMLYTGTATDVSNIGNGTFILTGSDGTTYTVNVPSGATIWNAAREPIALSNIATNDSIRLDGSLASDG